MQIIAAVNYKAFDIKYKYSASSTVIEYQAKVFDIKYKHSASSTKSRKINQHQEKNWDIIYKPVQK